jgi:hypothetical protein
MVKQYRNIKIVLYATNNTHMKITFSHTKKWLSDYPRENLTVKLFALLIFF